MFKKLFGQKHLPQKKGKEAVPKAEQARWIKVYHLVLSNMEGNPSYPLKHQLTFGSEVGNIIISDSSVSPRHCTFILQGDLISVMDHASKTGTLINGKKIPAGKYIILEETDVVNVGDLEVRIQIKDEQVFEPLTEVEAKIDEEIPLSEPSDKPVEEVPKEETTVEPPEELPEEPKEEPKEMAPPEEVPPAFEEEVPPPFEEMVQEVTQGKIRKEDKTMATNSLVRVFAVLGDFIIGYILMVLLFPYDDFRAFLDFVPQLLGELFAGPLHAAWSELTKNYNFLAEILTGVSEFILRTFPFGSLVIMFAMVRILSTLLFGVSLAELLLGVKASGNIIWKRLGGLLRVLIGFVTWPFLIFDAPSVLSKRTFKELITFTRTYLNSALVATFGILMILPLLMVVALIAPLFQGFDVTQPVVVNENIEERLRVNTGETPQANEQTSHVSQLLKAKISYDPASLTIIPSFRFQEVNKKLHLKSEILFYHRDIQKSVSLVLFKNFDLRQLVRIGLKGNVLLFEDYPELYNFAYSSDESNPAFKKINDEKANNLFATEFISFTDMAFELKPGNVIQVMQEKTPFIKTLLDYKASFLALLEYKDFDDVGFLKMGNVFFMRFTYLRQKPFDLLVPIIKDEGRLLKISFENKESYKSLANTFYKYTLDGSDWLTPTKERESETLSPFEAMELFTKLNANGEIDAQEAQGLYGYYFEMSSSILKKGDPVEFELWSSSISSMYKILETLADKVPADVDNSPVKKLQQNFRDLKEAFEGRSREYFGITDTYNV